MVAAVWAPYTAGWGWARPVTSQICSKYHLPCCLLAGPSGETWALRLSRAVGRTEELLSTTWPGVRPQQHTGNLVLAATKSTEGGKWLSMSPGPVRLLRGTVHTRGVDSCHRDAHPLF